MKNRGFTLIELLVVIAIIGVLSAVVLAALGSARSRGSAASVQNQLANMRPQAELFYNTTGNNSYGSANVAAACPGSGALFATTGNGLGKLIAGIKTVVTTAADVQCVNTTSAWAVAARDPASSTSALCIDSSGIARSYSIGAGLVSTALSVSAACN